MSPTGKEIQERYPEHEKQRLVIDAAQEIGAFLDWLREESEPRIHLAQYREFDECDEPQLVTFWPNINQLLADYFGIDLKKIDAEKDAMLADIRGKQGWSK